KNLKFENCLYFLKITENLNVFRNNRKSGKPRFQIFICRDVVCHPSVIERLICVHVKISGSGQPEEDGLLFSRLLALHRLVDGYLYRMAALRRRKDSFYSCKLLSRFKDRRLLYGTRLHIA